MNNFTRRYYLDKGYPAVKRNEFFEVKVEDLMPNSTAIVQVLCDYCNSTIFDQKFEDYNKAHKRTVDKDCCDACRHLKQKESNLINYGVENTAQLEEVRQKVKKTCLEKYGTDCSLHGEVAKKKTKQSMIDRYGVEYYPQTEEYLDKTQKSNLEKYNVNWAGQIPEARIKGVKTRRRRYGNKYEETVAKIKQTNIEKYGAESYAQTDEFKKKFTETNLLRIGFEYPSQSPEIYQKTQQTLIEKYGYEFKDILKNQNVKKNYLKGLKGSHKVRSSKQQVYLCKLFNARLNDLIGDSAIADMSLREEKIYIEYDGGGHDLSVRLGLTTEQKFKHREIRRWYALNKAGWREIRIISVDDKIPSDEKLLEMINFAKEYLNTGHSWIRFYISEGRIESSQFNQEYDYGVLRRIHSVIDENII